MLLLVSVGSIYASDNSDFTLNSHQDDFDLDDDSDYDDDLDEDLDDDSDYDDDLDEDLDDDSDFDDDFDYEDDDNSSDYFSSYEFLEFKIISYLNKFGNCSDENWTVSQEFLNEYQIYLSNSSNFTLNSSLEGYETYLKIFDSITSTFGEYNLTENQTEYLKFLIIYYLNHYGNVSANYTWNESDEFKNYEIWGDLAKSVLGCVLANETSFNNYCYNNIINLNNSAVNSTDVNSTLNYKSDDINVPEEGSDWNNIVLLVLVLILVVFVII